MVMVMADKEQEIREALAAATPGPWDIDFVSEHLRTIRSKDMPDWAYVAYQVYGDDNAHLIANAPEWLLYLLDKTATQSGEIESLRSQLDGYMSPEEYDRREENLKRLIRYAKGQEEKARYDQRQAEQERDELATLAEQQGREMKSLQGLVNETTAANTAMRECLQRTYNFPYLESNADIRSIKRDIQSVLSRYTEGKPDTAPGLKP